MTQTADIQNRIGVMLNDLIERNALSNRRFAKIMECDRNTINSYRQFQTIPNSIFINRLANLFGANLTWVYTGAESMYHGDGLGPRPDGHAAIGYDMDLDEPPKSGEGATDKAASAALAAVGIRPQNGRIAAALEKAVRILESKTSYSNVLVMNIEHLERALKATTKYTEMSESLIQLQNEMASLQKELGGLNRPRPKPRTPGKKKTARKTGKTRKTRTKS